MKRRGQLIVLLLALLAGISAGFLVRQLLVSSKKGGADAAALQEANARLLQERERNEVMLAQNDELEQRKKILLERLEEVEDVAAVLSEMKAHSVLSGMTDVQGSGLVLTMDDKLDYDPLTDPIEAVIHDSTVNYVLNLLWSSGARAIAFNGVRLTAVSEISCVGPTILCYGVRQMPPYVIEAIGPQADMERELATDSYLLYLTQDKIGVRLSTVLVDDLTLPSFSRSHDFLPYIDLLRMP